MRVGLPPRLSIAKVGFPAESRFMSKGPPRVPMTCASPALSVAMPYKVAKGKISEKSRLEPLLSSSTTKPHSCGAQLCVLQLSPVEVPPLTKVLLEESSATALGHP